MNNVSIKTGWLKVLISWCIVFALRLIPHRIPNIEGIMATMMPFSKRFGGLTSFVYGAFSIALFDLVVSEIGTWTLVTSVAYGFIGMVSAWYFRSRQGSRRQYVFFAIVMTILYDLVTGVIMGPLLFGQPFVEAIIGQIPFTIYHLVGNIVLSAFLSPILHKWVIQNELFETDFLWRRLLSYAR